MDTPRVDDSMPATFVLLVVRADDCLVCQDLESRGVFSALQSIMCVHETIRLETTDSYVWPEYLTLIEGYPKIACMTVEDYENVGEESTLLKMEFFNHTYDNEIKMMLQNNTRPVTLKNVQDFCDGFVSRMDSASGSVGHVVGSSRHTTDVSEQRAFDEEVLFSSPYSITIYSGQINDKGLNIADRALLEFMERVRVFVDMVVIALSRHASPDDVALTRAKNFKDMVLSIRGYDYNQRVAQKRVLGMFKSLYAKCESLILSVPDGRWLKDNVVNLVWNVSKKQIIHISNAYILSGSDENLLYGALMSVLRYADA